MESLFLFIINSIIIYILASKSNTIANKLELLDTPSEYKIHKIPVPSVGGILIYILLLLNFIFLFIKNDVNFYQFFYISIFFLVGFIDDKFNLNSYYKILFTAIFSLILIFFDDSFLIHKIFFEISNNEFYFGKIKIPITIFCILLLFIAMSMSDGINCLLISFSIVALFIINIFILEKNLDIISMSLLSSLLVLMYFNYRNKIFLGNAGANLLAAYFIYLLINGNYASSIDVFQVISIFLIMGIDMVRLIFLRLLNKKNPFSRDLDHFHYILVNKYNLSTALFIYFILSFMPSILSKITDLSAIIFIPFQVIIYSLIIYSLVKKFRSN